MQIPALEGQVADHTLSPPLPPSSLIFVAPVAVLGSAQAPGQRELHSCALCYVHQPVENLPLLRSLFLKGFHDRS